MEDQFQISVRFRRDKTTLFIACTLYEPIDSLKRKLLIFHRGSDINDIRLYHATKLLDDKSNVHDQGISNNSLIYYKLKKGNTNQWEDLPEITL